ncbi:hypothetical protein [Spongorhabdus nitratireducens]
MYEEMQRLLGYIEPLNDGKPDYSEFKCRRVLSQRELITACYHDLLRWTDNQPGSPSELLQQKILKQFQTSYSWLTDMPKVDDADLEWLVQEYICAETGDYSFGVFNAGKLQSSVQSPDTITISPENASNPALTISELIQLQLNNDKD